MDSTYQTTLHCVDFDSLAYLSIISQKIHGCDVFKTTIQKKSGNLLLFKTVVISQSVYDLCGDTNQRIIQSLQLEQTSKIHKVQPLT